MIVYRSNCRVFVLRRVYSSKAEKITLKFWSIKEKKLQTKFPCQNLFRLKTIFQCKQFRYRVLKHNSGTRKFLSRSLRKPFISKVSIIPEDKESERKRNVGPQEINISVILRLKWTWTRAVISWSLEQIEIATIGKHWPGFQIHRVLRG